MTALRVDLGETEADFQRAVIQVARTFGYKCAHFRTAKTPKGWRTPVQADGKGFPDLLLVGRGRIIFAELKSATGRMTLDQMDWQDWLEDARQEFYVWRPADFDEIVSILTGKKAA